MSAGGAFNSEVCSKVFLGNDLSGLWGALGEGLRDIAQDNKVAIIIGADLGPGLNHYDWQRLAPAFEAAAKLSGGGVLGRGCAAKLIARIIAQKIAASAKPLTIQEMHGHPIFVSCRIPPILRDEAQRTMMAWMGDGLSILVRPSEKWRDVYEKPSDQYNPLGASITEPRILGVLYYPELRETGGAITLVCVENACNKPRTSKSDPASQNWLSRDETVMQINFRLVAATVQNPAHPPARGLEVSLTHLRPNSFGQKLNGLFA